MIKSIANSWSMYVFLITGISYFVSCRNFNTPNEKLVRDIIIENRDTLVHPGEDFFSYANGSWLKNNKIPSEESYWGIANLVVDQNSIRLKEICEKAAMGGSHVSVNESLIGRFWKEAMDSIKCDKIGINPLKHELQRIDALMNKDQLLDLIAIYHSFGVNPVFEMFVGQDDKNSNAMTLYIVQGGINLPNRDYYFNTDARTAKIRQQYKIHIKNQLLNIGINNAQIAADNIYSLEESLAKNSKKIEDLRDPYANYNPHNIELLKNLTPNFDWDVFFKKCHIHRDTVIVGQPSFFKAFDLLWKTTNLDVWKVYLKWNLVQSFSATLNSAINDEHFDFYGKKIRGIEKQKPRWKRALADVENSLGDALGEEFVKNYFSPKAKERYIKMVEDVRNVFRQHIQDLSWMSPETKEKAIEKLDKMQKKVGYPDKWKDYSTLKIDTLSYFDNLLQYRIWEFTRQIEKLNRPVDRSEWGMTPQTYNAYYNASNNEIVLPAAIFTVPGYKDEELDDALVYGYAGATTIGHEITHGFDDQGRQYDAYGNLNNWWNKNDEMKFNSQTDKLISLFNGFTLLDSLQLNGKATLGENIADLGGAVLGLDAFKLTNQYKEGKLINGQTPVQRYFMGYSLGWLGHIRNEALADQILTDVHAPAKFRVNGPFMNMKEFYDAFSITAGMKMYLPDSLRTAIW